MYVNQIMKNKGDGPRNQASISGELKISELVADLVEKRRLTTSWTGAGTWSGKYPEICSSF